MTFSNFSKGLSAGKGSVSKTSRAAPPRRPDFKAWMSAASSTTGPLEVLINIDEELIH
jgi:hypothetical protein